MRVHKFNGNHYTVHCNLRILKLSKDKLDLNLIKRITLLTFKKPNFSFLLFNRLDTSTTFPSSSIYLFFCCQK